MKYVINIVEDEKDLNELVKVTWNRLDTSSLIPYL